MKVVSFKNRYEKAVVDLIIDIQQNEFGVSITAEEQPDLLQIPEFYQTGRGNFWVAVDDQEVLGTIALLDMGKHQVALRKMFVSKAHRGSDQGVAKKLLIESHNWAADKGVTDIYLGTIDVYHAAMRFYEKHGYQRIQKATLPSNFPLIAVDNVFYHKVINKSIQRC